MIITGDYKNIRIIEGKKCLDFKLTEALLILMKSNYIEDEIYEKLKTNGIKIFKEMNDEENISVLLSTKEGLSGHFWCEEIHRYYKRLIA